MKHAHATHMQQMITLHLGPAGPTCTCNPHTTNGNTAFKASWTHMQHVHAAHIQQKKMLLLLRLAGPTCSMHLQPTCNK